MQRTEVIIETLDQFMEWIKQFNVGPYLFRGVSKRSYKLEASAYRRLWGKSQDDPDSLLDITKQLIRDARGQGHDEKNGRMLDDLELLAELQHFGAATCLIDFSRNPLVALWFACQQSSKAPQQAGKVYVVRLDDGRLDDLDRFEKVTYDLIKKDIDYFFKLDKHGKYPLYQWVPKLQNNRIITQSSVFIFGGAKIEADFECVIRLGSKQKILKNLDQLYYINEERMYPDFDGFARQHSHYKPVGALSPYDHLQQGIDANSRGDREGAIHHYSRVIELETNDPYLAAAAHNNRGRVFTIMRDTDRAAEDYDESIALVPNNAEVYNNRGLVFSLNSDFLNAIAFYNRAIELNPALAMTYQNRGNAYQKIGETDKALTDYNKMIELRPDVVGYYIDRGSLYHDMSDYRKAMEDYDKAIELAPSYPAAYHHRGNIYNKQDNLDLALEDYSEAIRLNPDYAEAYNSRGTVYQRIGNLDLALEDYSEAIRLNPNFAEAYNNRGTTNRLADNFDRAIVDFNRAIELNPDNPIAYNNRSEVFRLVGDEDRAAADALTADQLRGL